MKKTQSDKILGLLERSEWVCAVSMIENYTVDYRARLSGLKKKGIELESRRCTQHKHSSGLKEWKLKNRPLKQVVEMVERDGVRVAQVTFIPV